MKRHLTTHTNFAWFGLALIFVFTASLLLLPAMHAQEISSRASNATPQAISNGLIAFQSKRDGNYEIYTVKADGTSPRNMTNNPANDVTPAWSPDGNSLAFASDVSGNQLFDIVVSNSTGFNGAYFVTSGAFQFNLKPVFSPDQTKIAWTRGAQNSTSFDSLNIWTTTGPDPSSQTPISGNSTAEDSFPSWQAIGAAATLPPGVDLSLTMKLNPSRAVTTADPFRFQLFVQNNSTIDATNVKITDTIPSGATF